MPRPEDPQPKEKPLNGLKKTAHFDWGPIDVDEATMGDTKIVSWAVDFLNREQEKPFFLAVGLYRPHLPWYVPKKYFEPYPPSSVELPAVRDNDLDDIPAAGRNMAMRLGDHERVTKSNNWEKAVSSYPASIAFADAQLGRLFAALEQSPHAKKTLIVLWSDHGWHLGEKNHWRKFALWEEATRVPLVIVTPGSKTHSLIFSEVCPRRAAPGVGSSAKRSSSCRSSSVSFQARSSSMSSGTGATWLFQTTVSFKSPIQL